MAVAEAPSRPIALPEATLLMLARPFDSDGLHRLRGEVVERGLFKSTRAMEACSWLLPVPHGVKIATCACGRRWVSQEAAAQHVCGPAPEAEAR